MGTGSKTVMINYANANPRNFIAEYRRISIEDIKNNTIVYI